MSKDLDFVNGEHVDARGLLQMNAKEAREIFKDMRSTALDVDDAITVGRAHGYLEALQGPEVKLFLDFIEYFLGQERMTFMECSQAEDLWCRAKDTLAQFKEAVEGEEK